MLDEVEFLDDPYGTGVRGVRWPSVTKVIRLVAPLCVYLTFPDWLPPEGWKHWNEHRIVIKKPLRDRAAELAIKKLKRPVFSRT